MSRGFFTSDVGRRAARTMLSALIAGALLTSSVPAAAQPADAEARRTQLFQEGRRLADEGRWAEAAERMRQVISLRSAPKALIALALVERELTRHLEARALLTRAIADAQAQSLADDEVAAKKALAELEAIFCRVELSGASSAPELAVFVDDQPAVRIGDAVLVDPGRHVLRLEASGRKPQREEVTLAFKQKVTILVGLEPAASLAPNSSTPAAPPEGGGPSLVGPLVLGGVGLAAGAAGAVLLALGAADQADAEEQCGGTTGCPESVRPLVDSGANKIIAGDVVLGVGGALAVGGAIWLIVEARWRRLDRGRRARAARWPRRELLTAQPGESGRATRPVFAGGVRGGGRFAGTEPFWVDDAAAGGAALDASAGAASVVAAASVGAGGLVPDGWAGRLVVDAAARDEPPKDCAGAGAVAPGAELSFELDGAEPAPDSTMNATAAAAPRAKVAPAKSPQAPRRRAGSFCVISTEAVAVIGAGRSGSPARSSWGPGAGPVIPAAGAA